MKVSITDTSAEEFEKIARAKGYEATIMKTTSKIVEVPAPEIGPSATKEEIRQTEEEVPNPESAQAFVERLVLEDLSENRDRMTLADWQDEKAAIGDAAEAEWEESNPAPVLG
jgi:hypothetical protein